MSESSASNVAMTFVATARTRPDDAAIIDRVGKRDRRTTFAELDDWSARLATLLREAGVESGDRILLLHPPTAELYAFVIALLRVGAVATVLEPSASRAQIAAALDAGRPRGLFASRLGALLAVSMSAMRRVPVKFTTTRWIPGTISIGRARGLAATPIVEAVRGDHPALLTFTSGSTGVPKGAIRTHDVLRAQHVALRSVAAAAGETDLVSLPIVVLTNLAAGATSILPAADLRRPGAIDPVPVLAQIERLGATRITASPALVDRLVSAPGAASMLRGVKRIVTGGGPIFPDLIARARASSDAEVVAVYGSTEAEPVAHLAGSGLSSADVAAMRGGAGLLAGRPVPETQLRIVPRDAPLAASLDMLPEPGTIGEIVVSGAHVVLGYLDGRGDAETKIRHAGRIWHRTGDLGSLDERGRLWLFGRVGAAIEDERGRMFPFAVECAARLVAPGRTLAAASAEGKRVLLVRERLAPSEHEALEHALRWASIDTVVDECPIPLDRRHNSKVDYPALRKLLGGRAMARRIRGGR
ncbi:MAG: AMP-binding protein [Gemmatimonadaceae bacterium]|nr:AMP-binding protein [Gemmatimonadaceae bacterium]NUQ93951.1 AMP-binding protein [Gemmatimonadaceae bacterium]NUR20788.1 AMP-binding protein [Gemmatimonadaceae bacterium]